MPSTSLARLSLPRPRRRYVAAAASASAGALRAARPGLRGFATVALAALTALLVACGGASPDDPSGREPAAGTAERDAEDDATVPAPDAAAQAEEHGSPEDAQGATPSLRAALDRCPYSASLINKPVACLVGLWEGRTTDGADDRCALNYLADGTAYYLAGARAQRIPLSALSSGSVYAKQKADTPSGYALSLAIGIASGRALDLYYQHADQPRSARGLLVVPADPQWAGCLFTAAPSTAVKGASVTTNRTGRRWQPAARPDPSHLVAPLDARPGYDAGMADDGTAVIAYRQQRDDRVAVAVVTGRPGDADTPPRWSDPVVLDDAAPLLDEPVRPRVAVSRTGHAVVSWYAARPCEADAYEADPAGKTCRYFYAARRLAGARRWEPAQRVRAAVARGPLDSQPTINARGDIAIAYTTFTTYGGESAVAVRAAGDASYRSVSLQGFRYSRSPGDELNRFLAVDLDDAGHLTVAGETISWSGGLKHQRSTLAAAGDALVGLDGGTEGLRLRGLAANGGAAGYLWSRDGWTDWPRLPESFTPYSIASQTWLAPRDITRYVLWGDSRLVSSTRRGGELLLYSGCRVTVWRDERWGRTQALPAYCGLDRAGGVYAFNRRGDYVGLNWAGRPGQWGYYRAADRTLLKGPPGRNPARARDYLLGRASGAFGDAKTQLFLSPEGLALAVTTNDYTRLPSADAAGRRRGPAGQLWAVYLR